MITVAWLACNRRIGASMKNQDDDSGSYLAYVLTVLFVIVGTAAGIFILAGSL